jgi:hypothetical protein
VGVSPTTTKLSISVPNDLLARADKLLAQPGEGRSALLTRVLEQAVCAAEEAAIDAQYDRALREHQVTQQQVARGNAIARAAIRTTRRPGSTGGTPV